MFFVIISGTHHKGSNCDPNKNVNDIEKLIETKKEKLFPKTIELGVVGKLFNRLKQPNGGWSDIRDHLLCKSFITYDEMA